MYQITPPLSLLGGGSWNTPDYPYFPGFREFRFFNFSVRIKKYAVRRFAAKTSYISDSLESGKGPRLSTLDFIPFFPNFRTDFVKF